MAHDDKPQRTEDAPKEQTEIGELEREYQEEQGEDEQPSPGEARGTGTDA